MSDNVKHITDSTFEAEVLKSPTPVIVDFWAPWCGPCRAIAPALEEIANDYQGRARVVKLNTDDNPEVATRFGIRSIPTVMIFKGGKVVETLIGSRPKSAYASALNQALTTN